MHVVLQVNLTFISHICMQGALIPLVTDRAGEWYPAKYKTGSNLRGVYGYKVFVAIALFLGDGLYNLVKIIILSVRNMIAQQRAKKSGLPVSAKSASESHSTLLLLLTLLTQNSILLLCSCKSLQGLWKLRQLHLGLFWKLHFAPAQCSSAVFGKNARSVHMSTQPTCLREPNLTHCHKAELKC